MTIEYHIAEHVRSYQILLHRVFQFLTFLFKDIYGILYRSDHFVAFLLAQTLW